MHIFKPFSFYSTCKLLQFAGEAPLVEHSGLVAAECDNLEVVLALVAGSMAEEGRPVVLAGMAAGVMQSSLVDWH